MENTNISVEAIFALREKIENGEAELMVDLAGDKYADPDGDNPVFEDLYAEVIGVTKETPECIVVHFEGMPSVGFPVYHQLKVGSMKA